LDELRATLQQQQKAEADRAIISAMNKPSVPPPAMPDVQQASQIGQLSEAVQFLLAQLQIPEFRGTKGSAIGGLVLPAAVLDAMPAGVKQVLGPQGCGWPVPNTACLSQEPALCSAAAASQPEQLATALATAPPTPIVASAQLLPGAGEDASAFGPVKTQVDARLEPYETQHPEDPLGATAEIAAASNAVAALPVQQDAQCYAAASAEILRSVAHISEDAAAAAEDEDLEGTSFSDEEVAPRKG